MKKLSCLAALGALVVVSGCATSGITVNRQPEKTEKLAIVEFRDCDQSIDRFLNCEGSGKIVSGIYSKVLNAPVIKPGPESSDFDVLLVGDVTEYNVAVPMAFRPNVASVALKLIDKKGNVLATQRKVEVASNVFGSATGCAEKLAEALKTGIKRD